MKIFPLIAAAAVAFVAMPAAASAAPAAAPAAAAAQHVRVSINDRHHGGRHHGWRNQCTTTWRHHRRVRTCHRTRW